MKPKTKPEDNQLQLFQAQFEQLLNVDHPLCKLARRIDWSQFEAAFADCYCPDFGAPAKSVRLMVGLHYLKHTFNESDESLLERWLPDHVSEDRSAEIILRAFKRKRAVELALLDVAEGQDSKYFIVALKALKHLRL